MKFYPYNILICFLLFFSQIEARSLNESYADFDNFHLSSDASMVYCFIQDQLGVLWLGSDKGLYSYDGYNTIAHLFVPEKSGIQTNTKINCGIMLDQYRLCLGTDAGILFFNTKTDAYEKTNVKFPSDVRSLTLSGKFLWIGSLYGLYRYDTNTKRLENITALRGIQIPNKTIYSILKSKSAGLFIGTYNGLSYSDNDGRSFHEIKLPVSTAKSSLLVNSLLEDDRRKCIWIGTEGYLFSYSLQTQQVRLVPALTGNSIKSLALDFDGNLLAGTDNGLYAYQDETGFVKRIIHDSRSEKSLTNNIIWSILVDRSGNAWFGTDYGVSHYTYNQIYRFVRISEITGMGDGTQLQCIFRDSHKNLWLGGTNGLLCLPADKAESYRWYKMGDSKYPISHNRIRSIYEDPDGMLWVATDGSINRYDEKKKQFVHYNIVDKSRTRNANWAYQIFEDKRGKLWIATCLGGVFVVDKTELLKDKTGYFVAEQNFYKNNTKSGISDNYVLQIVPDQRGNVWALTYDNRLNKIDPKTGHVTIMPVAAANEELTHGNSYSLICDKQGNIWVGYSGGVAEVKSGTQRVEHIQSAILGDGRIKSLSDDGKYIWLTGSEGTFVLDKNTRRIRHVKMMNQEFSCNYYDAATGNLYLGTVDGFLEYPVDLLNRNRQAQKLMLTGLIVNEKLFQAGRDYDGLATPYLKEITLPHDQNNITFEFSDLGFMPDEDTKYVYRLDELDDSWRTLKSGSNKISYSNLAPGNYVLSVGVPGDDESNPIRLLQFSVKILPPWYYSLLAKIIYVLIVLGLLFWVAIYFRDKHNNRIDRIEREKTLELSRLKIDFFTNVSHDFKTPLSLIIGPISKLLMETKNATLARQLQLVQKNALHLNKLIQQVIGFDHLDASLNNTLILSQLEIVEFCKGIFSVYEDGFRQKRQTVEFISDVESLNIDADVVKLESVVNNLLSNAMKYSPEGAEIKMHLSVIDDRIRISVSNTGATIDAAELPYVFDRFFQSDKTRKHQEGSGIGLYLVKYYTELHHGTVGVVSDAQSTIFTVELPLNRETEAVVAVTKTENQSKKGSSEGKPVILVVEDNADVSEFVSNTLESDYHCIVAHNGKTGLEFAIKYKPNLIITDVMMPVMDGFEMCKQIRKNKDLMLVPIVMLTAKDDRKTEERSLALDVNAFISKPFDTGILLLKVRQLLATEEKVKSKIRIDAITTPKQIEAVSWDEKFLRQVTQIVESKIADPDFNVNKLSELAGVSSKQVYRRVKQLTGMTPVDYIRSIRLKKAAMLLAQQKFSVSEVMYLVGFSNASYFTKCFFNMYECTPKQYIDRSSENTVK